MERMRIALLAILFIGIAILVWHWSSSTVPSEPATPIEAPTMPSPPHIPSDRNAPPPQTAGAPQADPTPPVAEPVQPVPREPSPLAPVAPRLPERAQPVNPPKAVVTGTITVEGQPAVRFAVNAELLTDDGSKHGVPVETSGSGTYRIESPPGNLQIIFDVVDQEGARPSHLETLTVAANRSYQLDYDFQAAGSIRGEVSGIAEGENAGLLVLLGEYSIDATSPDDIYALAEEADGEMTVRRDGNYMLKNLEPGRYTVVVLTQLMDEQQIQEHDYVFRYVTGYVDVLPGQEAEFNVSLD